MCVAILHVTEYSGKCFAQIFHGVFTFNDFVTLVLTGGAVAWCSLQRNIILESTSFLLNNPDPPSPDHFMDDPSPPRKVTRYC